MLILFFSSTTFKSYSNLAQGITRLEQYLHPSMVLSQAWPEVVWAITPSPAPLGNTATREIWQWNWWGKTAGITLLNPYVSLWIRSNLSKVIHIVMVPMTCSSAYQWTCGKHPIAMGASEKIGYFQLERIGDSILFPVNGRHNYGKSPLLIGN